MRATGAKKRQFRLQRGDIAEGNSRSGLTMPLCVASPCSFARRVVMQYPNQLGVVTSGRGRQCDGASSGTSPIEKFWKEAIGKQAEPLTNRIKLSWTDELPFGDLLKQASALPPHTAIFWELMIVDAAGVVHEGDLPLERLHAVANAPIFSYDESFFGSAIVGGPLLIVADTSRLTGYVGFQGRSPILVRHGTQ